MEIYIQDHLIFITSKLRIVWISETQGDRNPSDVRLSDKWFFLIALDWM